MAINRTTMPYTTGVIGVWPDNIDCSLFRNLTLVKMYFIVVPENLTYCCEDGVSALSLVNFTYGKYKGPLDPRPYFDLGIVENFQPYWRYWNFWHVDTTNSVFSLHCDYVDMHQLYVRRLSRPTLRNGARYGGEILGILMGAVWFLALCRWLLWKLVDQCYSSCLGQDNPRNPDGQDQQGNPDGQDQQANPDGQDQQGNPDGQDQQGNPDGQDQQGNPDGQDQQGNPDGQDQQGNPDGQDQQGNPDGQDQQGNPDGQDQQGNPGRAPRRRRAVAIWMRPRDWIWGRIWMRGWADLFHDFIHLMLLALIGSCMMEAVGHSNVRLWRASVMFNTGVLYTYLTLLVLVSSVLRQLSTSWISSKLFDELGSQNALKDNIREIRRQVWVALNNAINNWRWMAVFGQTAVLVSMANYLTLVDDDSGSSMDGVAGIVLTTVAAASTWSFGIATVVLLYVVLFAIVDTFCRMNPCCRRCAASARAFILRCAASAWAFILRCAASAWAFILRCAASAWAFILRCAASAWAFILRCAASAWAFILRCAASAWAFILRCARSAWAFIAMRARIAWDVIIRRMPRAFIGRRGRQADGIMLVQIHGNEHTA
ncbi:hypothetical protein CY35_14G040700 [Sphagnum magellanicum]|nr:hypothetical protein CY35_14G040700 [Sphagnum magellanicum]